MSGRALFDDAALFDFEDPAARAPQIADRARAVRRVQVVVAAFVLLGLLGTVAHSLPVGVAAAALTGVVMRLLLR